MTGQKPCPYCHSPRDDAARTVVFYRCGTCVARHFVDRSIACLNTEISQIKAERDKATELLKKGETP